MNEFEFLDVKLSWENALNGCTTNFNQAEFNKINIFELGSLNVKILVNPHAKT